MIDDLTTATEKRSDPFPKLMPSLGQTLAAVIGLNPQLVGRLERRRMLTQRLEQHYHYEQPAVGHYGVFNGTRWRTEIQPRIREMIRATQFRRRIASSRSRVH